MDCCSLTNGICGHVGVCVRKRGREGGREAEFVNTSEKVNWNLGQELQQIPFSDWKAFIFQLYGICKAIVGWGMGVCLYVLIEYKWGTCKELWGLPHTLYSLFFSSFSTPGTPISSSLSLLLSLHSTHQPTFLLSAPPVFNFIIYLFHTYCTVLPHSDPKQFRSFSLFSSQQPVRQMSVREKVAQGYPASFHDRTGIWTWVSQTL